MRNAKSFPSVELYLTALALFGSACGGASERDYRDGRRDGRIVSLEQPRAIDRCPGTTIETGRKTFCLLQDPSSWLRAVERCADAGLRLARIDSPEQHAAVVAALAPRSLGMRLWIGLSDAEREGDWRWLSGEPPYNAWRPGEPNDLNGEDCAELIIEGGGFNDAPCSISKPALCESRYIER